MRLFINAGTQEDRHRQLYLLSYYGVFLGALAWAFYRGAAIALVQLLWLCALSVLAIPLSTLLLAVLSAQAQSGSLAVELTALMLGLALVLAAVRAGRRVQQGAKDSVWSASGSS